MRIKKMTASFGTLDNQTLTLGEGLNVIYAPNESGKSTWCAFIRAMLYGISTAQRARQGQQPDKIKFRPWRGTPMSGTMDIETADGPVTIQRRTTRANQPMQNFSAAVTGTDTPIPGLTEDSCGQTLTGVPREVFERTVFIRQAGLGVSNDPELEKRINALVAAGDEEQSYSQANKQLLAWRRHRSGRQGAIQKLEAEMAENRAALEKIAQAAQTAEELDKSIAEAEETQAQAVKRMEQARAQQRRDALGALSQARQTVQDCQQAQAQAERAKDAAQDALERSPYKDMGPEEARRRTDIDAGNVRELERLAAKLPPVWIAFIPLGLGVLAFLLSLLLPWQAGLIAAGGVLVLLFVMMYLRLQNLKKTKEETLAERDKILDAYGAASPEEMEDLLADYRVLWDEWQRASYHLEETENALAKAQAAQKEAGSRAMAGLDFTDSGSSPAALASQIVQAGRERLDALRQRRAMAEGQAKALGDPMVLRSVLAEQEQRRQDLLEQDAALALAIETLEQADRELRGRFSPQIAARAGEIFARLTMGRYDQLTLARDLSARVKRTEDTASQEEGYLSQGARDQLYLSLRLALCDLVLPEDDPCPIILDDALVTFDQPRLEQALTLLREMGETRQILLFSCQERESQYFANDQAVTAIRLS
ncbi:MAG: AAA family ATPase [Oscillospiraceae bacterium]|nr:AAA family ATPase [Oscillospiraceae bacterium]